MPCSRARREPATPTAPVYTQKIDAQGRAYATGKRKNAVARVWIKPGVGKISINAKDFEQYFARPVLQMLLKQPLQAADRAEPVRRHRHRLRRRPVGSGRRRAPRHLQGADLLRAGPAAALKKGGFLTRDSRVVERKKYGKMKARRSFQFSKR